MTLLNWHIPQMQWWIQDMMSLCTYHHSSYCNLPPKSLPIPDPNSQRCAKIITSLSCTSYMYVVFLTVRSLSHCTTALLFVSFFCLHRQGYVQIYKHTLEMIQNVIGYVKAGTIEANYVASVHANEDIKPCEEYELEEATILCESPLYLGRLCQIKWTNNVMRELQIVQVTHLPQLRAYLTNSSLKDIFANR